MALIDINWNPTPRELRTFGIVTLIGCAIVGLVLWSYALVTAAKVIWGVGAVIFVLGLALPAAAKPIYLLLSAVSWPIGYVISHVVLAVFYYGLVTGTGLVFRLVGRDPLQRRFDPQAETYWQAKALPEAGDRDRYFRQF